MRGPVVILSILISLIIALSITRIAVSNSIATNGVELVQLQQKSKQIDIENNSLKQKIYSVASLDYIYQRATVMGFVEDNTSYVVSSPQTIAQTQ